MTVNFLFGQIFCVEGPAVKTALEIKDQAEENLASVISEKTIVSTEEADAKLTTNKAVEVKSGEDAASKNENIVKISTQQAAAGTPEARDTIKVQLQKLRQDLTGWKNKPFDDFSNEAANNWWLNFMQEVEASKKVFIALLDEAEEAVSDGSELDRLEWWRDLKNVAASVQAEVVTGKDSAIFEELNKQVLELKRLARKNIKNAIESLEKMKADSLTLLNKALTVVSEN